MLQLLSPRTGLVFLSTPPHSESESDAAEGERQIWRPGDVVPVDTEPPGIPRNIWRPGDVVPVATASPSTPRNIWRPGDVVPVDTASPSTPRINQPMDWHREDVLLADSRDIPYQGVPHTPSDFNEEDIINP